LPLIERNDKWNVLSFTRRTFSMRKPRDYDAELKALTDKARQLRIRKQSQLGELVMATGADTLSADELAGALLAIATTSDNARREVWRKQGATFFSGKRDEAGHGAGDKPGSAAASDDRAPPAGGQTGTQ
jgi:DNA-binding protein H-NS